MEGKTEKEYDFGMNVKVRRVEKPRDDVQRLLETRGEPMPATNCLSCGYIYDDGDELARRGAVCGMCNSLIPRAARWLGILDDELAEEHRDSDTATKLKDDLVRYDQESSQRTAVIDDQNEYYDVMKMNAWMDEDEIAEALEREADLEENTNNERLHLTVDVMGRRIVITEENSAGDRDDDGQKDEKRLVRLAEEIERDRPYGGASAARRLHCVSATSGREMTHEKTQGKDKDENFQEDKRSGDCMRFLAQRGDAKTMLHYRPRPRVDAKESGKS
jgi:hypothetical protein